MNLVSITPEGIQTDIVFTASKDIYNSFLPVGEYIIKSLKINQTKVNQVLDNQSSQDMQSEIPPIPPQNDNILQSENPPIPTQNNALQQQTFRSTNDTFVTSVSGYGVYEEKSTNTFRPGEDLVLYLEPAGFEYKTISGSDTSKSLYSIEFSADFAISDTQGNVLTEQKGIPVSDIVSHHQNKEVFIPFTITQTSPFPPGNYVITYTIHDINSGKSFDIVKDVVVSDTLLA